jgi:four helix bundle protein
VGTPKFLTLKVYRYSERLADALDKLVAEWDPYHRSTVGEPLIRAADAIGANIAAGHGRGSYEGNKRYIQAARTALYETLHYLRRAYKRKVLTEEQGNAVKPIVDEVGRKLKSYLRRLDEVGAAAR